MYKHTPNRCTNVILGILLLMASIVIAQDNKRPKESVILLEKLFIEANREKILGNTEKAIQLYEEVLQKDNTNAVSNYELARLYQKKENWSKAQVHAAKAVDLGATNLYYNQLYATLLEQEGNYKKTVLLYTNLCNIYPDREDVCTKLAYYLTKQGKDDQAIKVYNSLEKRWGVQESTSMRKYKLYMKIGKEKKAVQELEQLIATYPKEPEHIIRLANFYASANNIERSKELYTQALTLEPNNATANMAMVEFFLQSGDTTRYLNALLNTFDNPHQELLSKIETLKKLLTKLKNKELSKKHLSTVTALGEKLVATHPNSSSANTLHGDLLYIEKRYTKAAAAYETALRFTFNDLHLWEHLLESLHKSDNRAKLQTYAQQFIEYYPSQATSYYYNGIAYYQKREYDNAIKALKEAMLIGATNMDLQGNALCYLAKTYEAQKKVAAAEEAFNEAILMAPQNLDIIHDYAYSLIQRNTTLSKAADLLNNILTKEPNNYRYRGTQSLLHYKQEDYTKAQQSLQEHLDIIEEYPALLDHYGNVLFKLGKVDEAVSYWKKALDKGASNTQLPRKISTRQLYE